MFMASSFGTEIGVASAGADLVPASIPFEIHPDGDPRRAQVEEFIRRVYARRFGARVVHFAPVLVSLKDRAGTLVAAAGYRDAAHGPLFLEHYLDAPVERVLARHGNPRLSRADIVEVGHLAAGRAGEGRRLIYLLGPHLASRGFQWVVGTLTQELRQLFARIGVAPLELGHANPTALGPDAKDWGNYYEHAPLVLAGHLPEALRRLGKRTA
ncbi:MAG TPA: thermostable hemolysin [Variovorax sp.]|jgi:hypothetical protein|nr:thermostable hemolysin [Variovorax sp.]